MTERKAKRCRCGDSYCDTCSPPGCWLVETSAGIRGYFATADQAERIARQYRDAGAGAVVRGVRGMVHPDNADGAA